MDEETKYADMVEIPVDTCTVTVKKSAKRGRKKASAEKLKQKVIDKVNESETSEVETEGFNAATEEYVDMVESGILDPVKVTRSALQNATSVASTLLTTESAVANIKEDTPAMPAGGAGMGGMM